MNRGSHVTRMVAAAAVALCGATAASAQGTAAPGLQSRPIRMLVPFPPGSAGDVIARALVPTASEIGRRTIIIDNRGGAAGSIAAELAAKSTPDGSTLFFGTTGALAINPAIYARLPYDPVRDFAGVTLAATSTYTIVVSPALPVTNLKEYVAYAKARPGELNLGSSGAGTSVHLSAELFNSVVGIKTIHVPYKGASEALTDLIAGRVHVMFASTSSAVPFVRGGRVKALAITGTERDPAMPELPTVLETGVADYSSVGFFGVLAPVATPKRVIDDLNETFVAALKTGEVKQKFAALGVAVAWSTPQAFNDRIKTEKAKWTKVARAIGAHAD